MGDGTILNGVDARRIHRSNAYEVRELARDALTYYRDRLMILAAMGPHTVEDEPWPDYVRREVDDAITEMRDEWWREFAAEYIIACPDDVVDDYDPPAEDDAA